VFFIVGRYEYRNKGLDIMTKALGRLNEQLKKDGSTKTVVALYWIPNGTYGIRKELLENKDFYRHIKHVLESHLDKIQNNIISDIISGVDMNNVKLFTQEFSVELKKQVVHFKKGEQPLFSTHYIDCEENDSVVKGFKDNGLMNTKADRVKVINYPVYLNGADGLIDLSYYDGIMGTHLGIFPSYYEPWGYTPLETAALGVPSITTDLAGFGRFIAKANVDGGIYVLKRMNRNEEDVIADFTDMLYKYTNNHQKDRVSQKLIAKKLSELADWKELIKNYITAHNLAIDR
jgi:glycogen(starch) synthase